MRGAAGDGGAYWGWGSARWGPAGPAGPIGRIKAGEGDKAGGPAPSFQPPYRTDHHDCKGGHHDDHHRHHWGHHHRLPSQ